MEEDEKQQCYLTGTSETGLEVTCPSCRGFLWVNLSWSGLPRWEVQPDHSLDRYFKCTWCNAILAIAQEKQLNLIYSGSSISKLSSNDILIIHEHNLTELLIKLLLSRVNIRDDGSCSLGGNFANNEELRVWVATTVSQLHQSNTWVRLPVLDIGG